MAQTDVFGLTLTYSYDQSGNVTQVADSAGGYVTTTYDANNRLQFRTWTTGGTVYTAGASWLTNGQLSQVTRFAGSSFVGKTVYSYDAAGRLYDIFDKDPSGAMQAGEHYTYLAGGQVQTETDNGGAAITFTYDGAYDVTGDGTHAYSYDKAGNRANSGYVIGTGNELLGDGTYSYTVSARRITSHDTLSCDPTVHR